MHDENKTAQEKGRALKKENTRLWGVMTCTRSKLSKMSQQQKQAQVGEREISHQWLVQDRSST